MAIKASPINKDPQDSANLSCMNGVAGKNRKKNTIKNASVNLKIGVNITSPFIAYFKL